ncbi:adenylate kinase [Candidatus Marinimicrobia bacterium]|jgi:adenylate kinase|nr:adenylate kinase [Candidatus Neomarinimicrobiota bacterium]MDB3883289.1 adenylate kinase [Candidatus Neomarinimicrobiota bacterium]MDB3887520.1 adenylate kinase [Candidatus Neomarinimicrobiota bacterium]MDC0594046.1 adenylate kinase [Candidatus Neomarinimicrobiota bacterium]MDC0878216.1 adenylate kinase [Candidatus Neomarinimicrobiota bacterium]|tara:strand:+ start:3651 stop:4205 length:555 start_codon:yes stop_codon:yes gene_type:complete
MKKFLIMGPPGAGKGTQAKILAEKYNLIHLSTGDILRAEIGKKTHTGLEAQSYMDAGNLVPDKVLLSMMESTLTELQSSGIILDGFPRTIPQAEGLNDIFVKLNSKINHVLNIHVEESKLIKRLIERAQNSGRKDDNEEVIIKRQKVYIQLTAPLIDYYKNEIIQIDGDGTIDQVTQRILEYIQ